MSLKTLVNQIKLKDETAFETLYHEYHKIVFYVIYQIVKNQEVTKDLVQETFFTVYNKIDQYGGGSLKYWIITIAKNIAINYYNRKIVKEQKIIRDDEIVDNIIVEDYHSLGKYEELLDENFNPDEKNIIVYHVVFGYSYKELGLIFNEKPKTIGKKCRQLVKTLKKIVKED